MQDFSIENLIIYELTSNVLILDIQLSVISALKQSGGKFILGRDDKEIQPLNK